MERKFTTTTICPALEDPDLGPLISHRHRERVLGFIEEAGDSGSWSAAATA
jgi:acyl-CoA reductase-like NAD-dependent aldehyde dehydrogenase